MLLALAPVALLSSHCFLTPSGLLQNASGAVASGFTDQVLTSTLKSKQVKLHKAEPPITEIIMEAKVHLTVAYPSKTFHKELKVGKAITSLLMIYKINITLINTHFFQGNIRAQLVEHRTGIVRSRVQTLPLFELNALFQIR